MRVESRVDRTVQRMMGVKARNWTERRNNDNNICKSDRILTKTQTHKSTCYIQNHTRYYYIHMVLFMLKSLEFSTQRIYYSIIIMRYECVFQ